MPVISGCYFCGIAESPDNRGDNRILNIGGLRCPWNGDFPKSEETGIHRPSPGTKENNSNCNDDYEGCRPHSVE